jgi:hypothetical protein
MKALLLKDFYMAAKYCRSYLLIAAVFIAIMVMNDGTMSMFYVVYPCLMCGMVPVNLLSYDERSGWLKYSAALPYTKLQIVSGKYLIGLIMQGAMLIVTGIAQGIKMSVQGGFELGSYLLVMVTVLLLSVLSSSLSLPFVFKLGTEKGRTVYLLAVGAVCGISVASSVVSDSISKISMHSSLITPLLCLLSVGVYALSWYLSYLFFKKREL